MLRRSKNKEAAYLFIQWLNSEDISTKRVQIPYTLRDPFRTSHYSNPEYLSKWPDAKDYLGTLKVASEAGLFDLSLIQTDKYEEVLRQGFSRLWAGEDAKKILDDLARQWDEITLRVGVEKQRAVYAGWAAKPGAYPTSRPSAVGRRRCPGLSITRLHRSTAASFFQQP